MGILIGEIEDKTLKDKIHYNRGDVVRAETINDIQDTAIDAHNMATEALDKADSVFQGNGTVVSVGGVQVGTLAFTSDPQQQLDTINSKIGTASSFNAEIVDQLPTTNISTSTFYLIKNSTSADDNTYSEYLYVNGKWELLGNTQVQAYDDSELRELINGLSTTKANKTDLANYYTKDQTYNITEVDAKVINLVSTSYLKSELNPIKTDVNTNKTNIATLQTDIVGKANKADLDNYTKTSDLAKVATSNDYNDLDNTPNTDLMVDIINEHSDSINEINAELAGKADKSEIPSISGLASESYVNTQVNTLQGKIDGKQDIISDLATIRSGASAGATAVQPSTLDSYYNKTQTGNLLADKVDKTTTINSKPLSSNITLSASDVGALPNTTKYGASLSLTMNTSTYVVTAQLKDQAGNNLGTAQTIDLPLESVVISGSYNATNKKVILTLKDGSTIDFSVADLIDGLASQSSVDAKYEKPSTGIPKTDLASDVQTSLGKADTALQSIPAEYITETELNAKGYASQSDLDEYLPLAGGDMTGAINHTYSGSTDYSKTELSVNDTSIISTVHEDGSNSPTTVNFGSTSSSVNLRGKNTNPTYNNNDLALKSDVITKTSQLENDAGFITTAPEGVALYETTGSNTDGAMTQKATTDELNKKIDKGTTLTGGYLTQYTTGGKIETTNITPANVLTTTTTQTVIGAKSYNANNHLIATCNTAYSSTTKTASLTGFTTDHLTDGCEIYVKFTNGNTAGNTVTPVKLNVNSTGDITMVISERAGAGTYTQNLNVFGWWNNNDIIKFVYDATYNYWVAVENITQHRLYSVANAEIDTDDFVKKDEIPTDFVVYDEETDVESIPINTNYANKVVGAIAGNVASLDDNGNLTDSGISSNNVVQSNKIGIYGTLDLGTTQTINASEWTYVPIQYTTVNTNNGNIFKFENNGIKYIGTKAVRVKITHTILADLNASTLYGFAVYFNGNQRFDCKRNSSAQVWTDTITNSVTDTLSPNDSVTASFISGGKSSTLYAWACRLNIEILGEA